MQLKRAFQNIIDNSIRYSDKLDVDISINNEGCNILFEDNGPGIPAEDQVNIFKEFYRAPSARKAISEGTGLGLAIVMRMVELHGGDIQVVSEDGQGTTFTVQLPRGEDL